MARGSGEPVDARSRDEAGTASTIAGLDRGRPPRFFALAWPTDPGFAVPPGPGGTALGTVVVPGPPLPTAPFPEVAPADEPLGPAVDEPSPGFAAGCCPPAPASATGAAVPVDDVPAPGVVAGAAGGDGGPVVVVVVVAGAGAGAAGVMLSARTSLGEKDG
jgi:hypothetical protein